MKDRNILLSPLFLRIFIPFGLSFFLTFAIASANSTMSSILVSEFALSPSYLGFMSAVYLIVSGLVQFPAGVLLDRYGARISFTPLLLVGAAGAAIYGAAGSGPMLILARSLIGTGLGVSLMAAYKAYSSQIAADRLPLVYGVHSLMGGLGGMFTARPVAVAMEFLGWRKVFFILAAVVVVCALLVWFMSPDDRPKDSVAHEPFAKLFAGMLSFLGDVRFLLVSAPVTAGQSVLFAYLYLWIGPWMYDVAGYTTAKAGNYIMFAFAGTAAGYLGIGVIADWLRNRQWLSWGRLYMISAALITLLLAGVAVMNSAAAAPLWIFIMFFSTMETISFPLTRNMYSGAEVGRALSLLNFMIFFFSFVCQWLIGAALNFFPAAAGHFSPEGHRACVAALAAFNFAAAVGFYYGLRKKMY